MAALTWRNVDTPDFRGALQGQIASTGMVSDALNALGKGLGQVKQNQTNTADSQALANALRTNDPMAYQQQLQGADLTGVSPETLAALDSRGRDLLARSVTQQGLDSSQYSFDRTKDTNADLDAAKPAFAALLEAGSDPKKQAGVRQQFGPILSKLSGDQQVSLAGDMLKLEASGLSNVGAGLNNDSKRFSHNNAVQEYDETRAAQAAFTDIQRGAVDTEGARVLVESGDFTPGVRTRLNNMLGQAFPGVYGPLGSDTGGGGSPVAAGGLGAGTKNGSPYDTTYQFGATAVPITSMKLGEVQNYQQTDLLPNKGASPVGAYKDKPWSEVRQEIAQNEVGQKLPPIGAAEVRAAQTDNAYRLMQNQGQGAAVDLPHNLTNTDTTGTAVDKLMLADFKGSDRADLIQQVNTVKKEAGNISAGQAAAIVARNISEVNNWNPLGSRFWGKTDLGNGVGVDDAGVRASVQEELSFQTKDQMLANAAVADMDTALSTAQETYKNAEAQLKAIMKRAESQKGIIPQIGLYRQRAAMAREALAALTKKQQEEEQFQPRGQQNPQGLVEPQPIATSRSLGATDPRPWVH